MIVPGLVCIKNDGTRMPTKRRHLCLHERMQRQRLEDVVQLAGALNLEDADVGPLSNDPPEMRPLALTLEVGRALVLQRAKPFELFGIDSVRGPNFDEDMEQQGSPLSKREADASAPRGPLARNRIDQSAATGLAPVSACRKTNAYSDADCWFCPVSSLPSLTT